MSEGGVDGARGGAPAPGPPSEERPGEAAGWLEIGIPLPPSGAMAAFEAGGLRLVLCNAGGAPYVVEDCCPHAFAPLSDGRLEGCVLECPLHGGKLDVRDGRPRAAPIRRPVRTFAVRGAGARLQVRIPPP